MSFSRYAAYKDSGVEWLGAIPAHWDVRRAKRLCEIRKRIAGILGHDVLSITQDGVKIKDLDSNDGQLSLDYSKYQLVEVGDFAMNHMDLLTGYVDISPVAGVTSPDYRVFALRDRSVCCDRYLLRVFQMGYRQRIFYAYGQGSSLFGRWRMPTEQFNDLPIPMPPVDEQVVVAGFLDRETAKIDALVAEQERLIELLKEKRQAVISHAVTKGLNPAAPMKQSGVRGIGLIPESWEVKRLRHVTPRLAGRLIVQPHQYFSDSGVPILFGNNIGRGDLHLEDLKFISHEADREFAACRVAAGDLLTIRVGDPGATVVVPAELNGCHFASAMLIRQSLSFDSQWLCHVMNSDVVGGQVDAVNYGAAQKQFNVGDAANFLLPVPPIGEQIALREGLDQIVGSFDALAAEARRAVDVLQERRSALISAAVTGQIDVRGVVSESSAA